MVELELQNQCPNTASFNFSVIALINKNRKNKFKMFIEMKHLFYINCVHTYTWILGVAAAKTAPWPSRGLHHCGKFLEPSDE